MPPAAKTIRSGFGPRWLRPASAGRPPLAVLFFLPLAALSCLSPGGGPLRADEPGAAYIFPAGGQQGTAVDVRVGGLCLHERCPWQILGPGVTASSEIRRTETIWFEGPMLTAAASQQAENYPQDYAGRVTIAADGPLGTRFSRLWTAQGATPSMRFVVGELPEVIEQEQDGAALPVDVTLPVTINGRIFPREDVDLWRFAAAAGQVVRVEACVARLGSPLEPQLELLDEQGQPVHAAVEMEGGDPALVFTAPASGKYQVRIHDVGYGGLQNHVYRLTVSSQPHVNRVYPLGGRRGGKLELELAGSNLATTTAQVELSSPSGEQTVRFDQAGAKSNPVPLDVDDLAEILEHEPNDTPAGAPLLSASAVCNGRIQVPGDVDLWSIEAKKGETIDLEVRASRLGSPLDAVLTVADAEGKQLAQADDLAPGIVDALLRFAVPADGVYTVAVADCTPSRGSEALAYRLRIDRQRPADFRLWMTSDALTLYRAGEARLKVEVERLGGFAGPIDLAFDNLPAGVTVSGNRIAENAAQTDVVLKADAAAPIRTLELNLQGTAQIAGAIQMRSARAKWAAAKCGWSRCCWPYRCPRHSRWSARSSCATPLAVPCSSGIIACCAADTTDRWKCGWPTARCAICKASPGRPSRCRPAPTSSIIRSRCRPRWNWAAPAAAWSPRQPRSATDKAGSMWSGSLRRTRTSKSYCSCHPDRSACESSRLC